MGHGKKSEKGEYFSCPALPVYNGPSLISTELQMQ